MQMEEFLSDPDNLRMIPVETHLCNWILVDGRRLSCPKIGNNAVLTNASLPLDSAWLSCMYSGTLIL